MLLHIHDFFNMMQASRAVTRWMNLFSQALTSPKLLRRSSLPAYQHWAKLLRLAAEDDQAHKLIVQCGHQRGGVLHCIAVCGSVMQCVAVCCSVPNMAIKS